MSISILICVHSKTINNDLLLIQALNSLKTQTYKKFEVVVVFDECWDQTIKMVNNEKYDFSLFKLIKEKKDGLANAKNYGLKHMTCDRVCFLDADDLYMPDKLQKQVEFIEKNDVDFLSTLAWNKYSNQSYLFESCFRVGEYETHSDLINVLDKENVLTHGAMMIKKTCLDELNGYRNIKGMEDWDLWKRAIQKGYKFHQLQDRLYVYTIGTSVAR